MTVGSEKAIFGYLALKRVPDVCNTLFPRQEPQAHPKYPYDSKKNKFDLHTTLGWEIIAFRTSKKRRSHLTNGGRPLKDTPVLSPKMENVDKFQKS